MKYTVKPEHFDEWGVTYSTALIDDAEVFRLADEWDIPVEDLFLQVEEAPETVTVNGTETTMEIAAMLMDDDIREALHAEGIADPQEFINRYCELHREKYDEDFTV